MTRLEIRALIRKHLGETTSAFWTDTELNSWINEAGNDVAFETKSIRTSDKFDTVSGTQEYTLSSVVPKVAMVYECWLNIGLNAGTWLTSTAYAVGDTVFDPTNRSNYTCLVAHTSASTFAADLTSVYWVIYTKTALWVRLPQTTREDLQATNQGYRNSTSGIPGKYYWDREDDLLGFDAAMTGNAIGLDCCELRFSQTFTDLTGDTDEGLLPEFLHLAQVWWVVATGYQQRGYGDKANDAWAKYEARIARYYHEKHREREDEDWVMKPEWSRW